MTALWAPDKMKIAIILVVALVVFGTPMLIDALLKPGLQPCSVASDVQVDKQLARCYASAEWQAWQWRQQAYQAAGSTFYALALPLYGPPSLVMALSILLFPAAVHGDTIAIAGIWVVGATAFIAYAYLLAVAACWAWQKLAKRKNTHKYRK